MIKNHFITFRVDYISRQGYYILRKWYYISRSYYILRKWYYISRGLLHLASVLGPTSCGVTSAHAHVEIFPLRWNYYHRGENIITAW